MVRRLLHVLLWAFVSLACTDSGDAPGGGGAASAGSGGEPGGGAAGSGGAAAEAGTGASAGMDGGGGSAGASGSAGADAAATSADAMWVWGSADFVVPAARSQLLAFALARGASRLYVHGYPELAPSSPSYAPAAWRSGLEHAAQQGIGVEILIGESSWTVPGPEQSFAIANRIEPIAAFFADPATQTKPVALHLDVEPHGLDAWKNGTTTSRQQLIAALCDFFALVRSTLDQNGASALKLHADLPSWWDSPTYTFSFAGKTATGYEHALSRLDAAALMSYSKNVSAVLANSAVEMTSTDASGKQVWIGVETNPALPDEALATRPDLENALAAIQGAYAGRPGYGGWAVHAYSYWSSMPGY